MRADEYGAVATAGEHGTAWRNRTARTADAGCSGNSACPAAGDTNAAACCADTTAAGTHTACDDSTAASARNRATAASFTASADYRRDDAVEWGSR